MNPRVEHVVSPLEALRQIAEFLPWPVFLLDHDHQIQFQSTEAHPWLKQDVSLLPGHCFVESVSKRDRERVRQFLSDCWSANAQPSLSVTCRLKKGKKRHKPVRLTAHTIPEGEQEFLALFVENPGKTLKAKRSLREQNRLMNNLLDNTGAVIYVKDTAGRYQFVNHLYTELFHISREEIVGLTDRDIFEEEIAKGFMQNDREIIESGEMHKTQELVPHDDGLHTYISVKFPLFDLNGRVNGMGGISTDITEELHHRQELQAAQAVQRLLYPDSAPVTEDYEIAGAARPAETVSGDYFDYIQLGPNRLVVAVGDVSGHGLAPALEMVEVRSYLRAILRTEIRLDIATECLNEFLYHDLPETAFVTLFLIELDLQTHTFRYVGAGHRGDFLKANGEAISLSSTGLMLGIDERRPFECSQQFAIEPGDQILVPTDGICEAMTPGGEIFGRGRMIDHIRSHKADSAEESIESLLTACQNFNKPLAQADDMTVVLIKRLSESSLGDE